MRSPLFTQLHQLFRFGKFSATECSRKSFTHTVIVNRPDVRPPKIEKKQHLDGPASNSANLDQSLDDFFVAHFRQSARAWNRPVDRFRGQIFDRSNFAPGKTGPA